VCTLHYCLTVLKWHWNSISTTTQIRPHMHTVFQKLETKKFLLQALRAVGSVPRANRKRLIRTKYLGAYTIGPGGQPSSQVGHIVLPLNIKVPMSTKCTPQP